MSDCEGPMAIRTRMRRARKEHKCCECRNVINIGDVYEFVSGIWDHRPDSFRTCALCADVRSIYVMVLRMRDRIPNPRLTFNEYLRNRDRLPHVRWSHYDDTGYWPAFGLLYDCWELEKYPPHTGLQRRLPHAA